MFFYLLYSPLSQFEIHNFSFLHFFNTDYYGGLNFLFLTDNIFNNSNDVKNYIFNYNTSYDIFPSIFEIDKIIPWVDFYKKFWFNSEVPLTYNKKDLQEFLSTNSVKILNNDNSERYEIFLRSSLELEDEMTFNQLSLCFAAVNFDLEKNNNVFSFFQYFYALIHENKLDISKKLNIDDEVILNSISSEIACNMIWNYFNYVYNYKLEKINDNHIDINNLSVFNIESVNNYISTLDNEVKDILNDVLEGFFLAESPLSKKNFYDSSLDDFENFFYELCKTFGVDIAKNIMEYAFLDKGITYNPNDFSFISSNETLNAFLERKHYEACIYNLRLYLDFLAFKNNCLFVLGELKTQSIFLHYKYLVENDPELFVVYDAENNNFFPCSLAESKKYMSKCPFKNNEFINDCAPCSKNNNESINDCAPCSKNNNESINDCAPCSKNNNESINDCAPCSKNNNEFAFTDFEIQKLFNVESSMKNSYYSYFKYLILIIYAKSLKNFVQNFIIIFIYYVLMRLIQMSSFYNRFRTHTTYIQDFGGRANPPTCYHLVHNYLDHKKTKDAAHKFTIWGKGMYKTPKTSPFFFMILSLLTIILIPFYSVIDTFFTPYNFLTETKSLNFNDTSIYFLREFYDYSITYSGINYLENLNEISKINSWYEKFLELIFLPNNFLSYFKFNHNDIFHEIFLNELMIIYINEDFWGKNFYNVLNNNILILFENINIYSLDILFCFFSIYLFLFILNKDSFSNNSNMLIPNKYQLISESFYKISLNLFLSNIGKNIKEKAFFIKVNTILIFILISNVQGMIPYMSTLTSSLSNTFFVALALFSSILITILSKKGWKYLLCLFMPEGCPIILLFLLIPIELISYVFRVVSLSVRLFANMMAGHTLLKVIVGFSWDMLNIGKIFVFINLIPVLTLFILTLLEVGVAFIQTYIFTILTCIYLKDIFFGH